MKILVIDLGGAHIKLLSSGRKKEINLLSGPHMTPARMVAAVQSATVDWNYDVISLGYPGPVVHGRPLKEPYNLGRGWVRFDYQKAFNRPIKIVNDAAMQALGSDQGGQMLFLGLGTGLGCALIVNHTIAPLELSHLPYKNGRSYEDDIGEEGLKRHGKKKWRRHVKKVVHLLKDALQADYVVLGGGNARLLKKLPPGSRLGKNSNAFLGGYRLWDKRYVGKETQANRS